MYSSSELLTIATYVFRVSKIQQRESLLYLSNKVGIMIKIFCEINFDDFFLNSLLKNKETKSLIN